ncbi:MAG: triose-phosphate isomerase [Verrucomicrobiota bacterium]
MIPRRKFIAGNWKMHKTATEAAELVRGILHELGAGLDTVDIVLCPPFTAIRKCGEVIGNNSTIKLGAQNLHQEAQGAYTGEISAAMLRDLFCRYVIIGHSERRQYFFETDAIVNAKAKAAFANKLLPIICIGEKLSEREAGKTNEVLLAQTQGSFAGFDEAQWNDTVVAYEPVWAIGTGKVATPEQAQSAHEFIRKQIAKIAGNAIAQKVRILYGGSVKPENVAEIMKQPDVDGALVGGASLDARSFVTIIKNSIPNS